LSSGVINYNDPGLFLVEVGGRMKFKDIPLQSELVFGCARTVKEINNGYLLGVELDFHNKFKISDSINFYLSFGYLLVGEAFEQVYLMNNSSIAGVGMDPVFKIDAKFEFKF